MKSFFISLLLLTTSITFSQEVTKDTISIENQFENIYRTSSTYQIYKVISKSRYQQLKENVLDSLKSAKKTILEKENLLKLEKENIKNIKETLSKTQLELKTANDKENSISLFGAQLSKANYNLLLWGIIILLLLGLCYFLFKFSRSNVLTQEAKDNLLDIETEFEQHRKKSLEREQKLRRQLQDEINKQRNL